jgi:hypothetical protein
LKTGKVLEFDNSFQGPGKVQEFGKFQQKVLENIFRSLILGAPKQFYFF